MRVRVVPLLVLAVLLAGCGGQDDAPGGGSTAARPAPPIAGTPIQLGRARMVVADRWKPVSAARQKALRESLSRFPGSDASGWLLKGSDGDTAMGITAVDLSFLGDRADDRIDTPKAIRDYARGLRTRLRRLGLPRSRFRTRPVTSVDGTPAVLVDAYVPDGTGGQILFRTLAVSRERRFYEVQVNGPTTDGPRIREVVERLRTSWEWDRCATDAATPSCVNG